VFVDVAKFAALPDAVRRSVALVVLKECRGAVHDPRTGGGVRGATPIELGPPKQRALLAILLLEANRVVAVDRIIDYLWRGCRRLERWGPCMRTCRCCGASWSRIGRLVHRRRGW
jgi:hypothetical protein